jgi:hypothetical protein
VSVPFTVGEKLRAQFRKSLRKGYVQNAQLDPTLSGIVAQFAEDQEGFIVRVDHSKEGRFWFSDRRVLFESEDVHELFRYDCVLGVHWMFKNLWDRIKAEPKSGDHLKTQYFDRLEIDLGDRICVLDGLEQAYSPLYEFFKWMLRTTPKS